MVKAIIDISESTNKTLNAIKVEYDLKTKSEAIDKLAEIYLADEPEIRPEYARKLLRRAKEKPIYVGTLEEFRKRYGVSIDRESEARQKTAKTPSLAAKRYR